jgi:hypothetical protein
MKVKEMTLRDYFAAQALIGMLSNPNTTESLKVYSKPGAAEIEIAKAVYGMAEAMLEQKWK